MMNEQELVEKAKAEIHLCYYNLKPCSHSKGFPECGVGEVRTQVCSNCQLTKLNANIESLINLIKELNT